MKTFWIFVLLLAILSACAPATPTEIPATMTPELTEADQNSQVVETAVVQVLAGNLGLDENEISVKSNDEVEFSNACMDIVAFSDVTCAQVVTPGRIVILEANGLEYEYHTSSNGDVIQPATLALTWTREGGIAGFCDRMAVFLSGEVYATNCRAKGIETAGTFAELISAKEQKQFTTWFLKFDQVNLDASDPAGVADRMSVTLEFYGSGSEEPSKTEEQALFAWAQGLYQKLSS